MSQNDGVPASPSGSQASPGAAEASPPSVSIPNAERHEARIARLLSLEEGWNGYNAPKIDPACIERARPFLKALDEFGMSPWLVPLSDGGVQIERHTPDDYTIEFMPDGRTAFYCDHLTDWSAMALLLEAALHLPPIKSVVAIERVAASGIAARSDETPQAAQPEARARAEGDAQNNARSDQ